MSAPLERDILFVALTRPPMFAGVSYTVFVANVIVATELFLILKSVWVIAAALALHVVGIVLSANEPRIIDLWIARVSKCPRIPNYRVWRCNSYRP